MNRLIVVLSVAMLISSFQVEASTLSWQTVPVSGIGTIQSGQDTPQDLFGSLSDMPYETNFFDKWTFLLSETSNVMIRLSKLPDNQGSFIRELKLDGEARFVEQMGGPLDKGVFATFNGELSSGSHTIFLDGSVATRVDLTGGYEFTVNTVAQAPVPVPAAGWLFFSAAIGLLRVSRRHKLS
jgi:hypothetical protein